jgi:hypothetical protein
VVGVLVVAVIAGLAILVGGGFLIVARVRGRAKKQDTAQPMPLYTLKIISRHEQNMLTPGGEGLWVCARVDAISPALQALQERFTRQITFQVQGPNENWIILKPPIFKDGYKWVKVFTAPPTLGAELQPGNPVLLARCSAGAQPLETPLKLRLHQELELSAWVNGQKQEGVVFDRSLRQPAWVFPDIITYLHFPGDPDHAVTPDFKNVFTTPPVQVDPPVLDVAGVFEHQPGQYTIKLQARSMDELERFLGKDLSERDGIIQVTVTANSDSGQSYQARVAYQIQPQFELFAHGWVDAQHRFYKDLDLTGLEFVCDAEDRLGLAVACCRTDKPGRREIGQVDLVNPSWWNWEHPLQGSAMPNFDQLPPVAIPEGGYALNILSLKPLLYTQEHAARKLTLHLEAVPTERCPANYVRTPVLMDLELKPRYPDLRLWLVPGKQRGASEAWMFLFLDQNTRQPLKEVTLRVDILSLPSSYLKFNDGSGTAACQTGEDGSMQVELFYEGLNWGNMEEARYTVACAIQARNGMVSESVKTEINVSENVRRLLLHLYQNSESLKLNNPTFQEQAMLKTNMVTNYRSALRGPIWNMAAFLAGRDNETKENKTFQDYVCPAMRDRIVKWLCSRRHYQPGQPDTIATIAGMNGIEFDHFCFGSLHGWEALFLSGMQPMDDPRGLDPWWKQHWQDTFFLEPDGLCSKTLERFYLLEMNSWITAVGMGALLVQFSTFFAHSGLAIKLTVDIMSALYLYYSTLSEMQNGPDSCYDPTIGYVFNESLAGKPASKQLYLYCGRNQFIKDWLDVHPQG